MTKSELDQSQRDQLRRRFYRLAEALANEEHDGLKQAALRDPGQNMLRGLELSSAFLADYQHLLRDPAFRAAEDERARRKADLHDRWRACRARTSAR